MDPGVAVVIAGAFGVIGTVIGTVVGIVVQHVLGRQGRDEDRAEDDRRATAERLRQLDQGLIDGARAHLLTTIDNALDGKKLDVRGSVAGSARFLDEDAAAAFARAFASMGRLVLEAKPGDPMPRMTYVQHDMLVKARLMVLTSLEEQENRIAAGDRITKLTTEQLQKPEWTSVGHDLLAARERLAAAGVRLVTDDPTLPHEPPPSSSTG